MKNYIHKQLSSSVVLSEPTRPDPTQPNLFKEGVNHLEPSFLGLIRSESNPTAL
jgi:hypothetical protein